MTKKTSTTVSISSCHFSHNILIMESRLLNSLLPCIFCLFVSPTHFFFSVYFYYCIITLCCELMCNAYTCICAVYLGAQAEGVQYHPPNASWPNPDIIKAMPFDYTIHDPKYDDISSVYSPGYKPTTEGRHSQNNSIY